MPPAVGGFDAAGPAPRPPRPAPAAGPRPPRWWPPRPRRPRGAGGAAAGGRSRDALRAAAYAGTAVLLLLAAAGSGHWGNLLRAVLGGLALAAAYLAVTVISRSGLGLGDVKLAASLGTLLAWPGWPTLLAGAFAGFLLGAVYGVGLLAARRATRLQRIPFGPFMIAGAFLAVRASAV